MSKALDITFKILNFIPSYQYFIEKFVSEIDINAMLTYTLFTENLDGFTKIMFNAD